MLQLRQMKKIVIFDSGWGGEDFADYLGSELCIADIIRVIDWRHAPYSNYTEGEIRNATEEAILPYIGHCDLIVLAGFLPSLSLEYLRRKYPKQQFTGLKLDLSVAERKPDHPPKEIILFADQIILNAEQLKASTIKITPVNPAKITPLIDDGTITADHLKNLLPDYNPNAIFFLANTHLWAIPNLFEQAFSRQITQVHQREQLFYQICKSLHLRGIDGRRR